MGSYTLRASFYARGQHANASNTDEASSAIYFFVGALQHQEYCGTIFRLQALVYCRAARISMIKVAQEGSRE